MTAPTSDRIDPSLQELVTQALCLRDEGVSNWLEEACAAQPAEKERVRQAVAEADALPQTLNEALGADVRIGTLIADRYRILRRLGAGAMGVVYQAQDGELGREVALKVLRHGLLDQERARQRFEREARSMASVEHASVLAIHDRGTTQQGEAFLVMELIDGRDLGALVTTLKKPVDSPGAPDRPVPPGALEKALGFPLEGRENYIRVVTRWVAELASGLSVAHAAGVVHRDVKPSNVMVRRDGRAVLLDFGIALQEQPLQDAAAPVSSLQSSIGTPAYLDPELLSQQARATARSDVYGLGAVLYCLLTLEPPYQGTATTILAKVATRPPEPLVRKNPSLPRDLVAIVEKGMSRSARDRYASAAELEQDLLAFLDHQPVRARPISPVARAWRKARRSKAAQGAIGALILLGAIAIATLARRWHLDQQQAEWFQLYRQFPPNFTIVYHENRTYLHEADRAALEDLLDRAANVSLDPLPTLLLRASFRFDHGDFEGAARDMRRVAGHQATGFAESLAERYEAASLLPAGEVQLDLEGLPEPETLRDRYLRGYHHLRDFEDADALELLDEEVREAIPHAEELSFALVEFGRFAPFERFKKALELHEDVLQLESRLGDRTASTAHFACYALSAANASTSALEAGLEGVQLAPRTHVNRTNVGWAAFVVGRNDVARENLRIANELRPSDSKPVRTMLLMNIAEGAFDAALQVVDQNAGAVTRVHPGWAESLRAEVETYRALNLWIDGNPNQRRSQALTQAILAARQHLAAGKAKGDPRSLQFLSGVLDALENDDEQALAERLANEFSQDVRAMWRLTMLRNVLPEHLDPAPMQALSKVLEALEIELAGTTRLTTSDL